MECLHTVLLGLYKHLTTDLTGGLSPGRKKEVAAKVDAFDVSGLNGRYTCLIAFVL